VLHPEEAVRRGLKTGDEVRLFNDRGAIGLVLQVSDEIQPGVMLVPGQRPTAETVRPHRRRPRSALPVGGGGSAIPASDPPIRRAIKLA
jgi:anaerobic selenocysteine-containing dehydrogenase